MSNFPFKQFILGVDKQPSVNLQTFAQLGFNTVVGEELNDMQGGKATVDFWDRAAGSLGLQVIRSPDPIKGLKEDSAKVIGWLHSIYMAGLPRPIFEEFDLYGVDQETLNDGYKKFKDAAPDVPIIQSISVKSLLSWTLEQAVEYAQSCDVIAFGLYPRGGMNLPGVLIKNTTEWHQYSHGVLISRLRQATNKPVIVYYEAGNLNKPEVIPINRYPATPTEVRVTIFDCLMNGAIGIVAFPQQLGYTFNYNSIGLDTAQELKLINAFIQSMGQAFTWERSAYDLGGTLQGCNFKNGENEYKILLNAGIGKAVYNGHEYGAGAVLVWKNNDIVFKRGLIQKAETAKIDVPAVPIQDSIEEVILKYKSGKSERFKINKET